MENQGVHPPMSHADAPHPEVAAHDPAREINTKLTVTALSTCAVFVFVCVWVLKQVFATSLEEERRGKVWQAPAEQLEQLRATEARELSGADGGRPVDQALREYVDK